jgi:dihydroorotate dehydrogenase (NAD+) catalytic subunit
MPSLAVCFGRLTLKNPVILASGTCGYGLEYVPYLDINRLGGIVIKGISLEPQPGNPPPRIVETPSGMLNAIGLQNIGWHQFVTDYLPKLADYETQIIVNIYGHHIKEYQEVAKRLSDYPEICALEINVSCPNVDQGGLSFGTDPSIVYQVTDAVRKATHLPIITKLSPNVTDIRPIAKAAEDAGVDAISLINTLLGMKIDIKTRRPALANVTGGLSGPAIRPVGVRMVWEVVKVVTIPVIGLGGIMTDEDALEFLIAGASAVQIGTGIFVDPLSPIKVLEGIESFLNEAGMEDIRQIIGSLNTSHERINECSL